MVNRFKKWSSHSILRMEHYGRITWRFPVHRTVTTRMTPSINVRLGQRTQTISGGVRTDHPCFLSVSGYQTMCYSTFFRGGNRDASCWRNKTIIRYGFVGLIVWLRTKRSFWMKSKKENGFLSYWTVQGQEVVNL